MVEFVHGIIDRRFPVFFGAFDNIGIVDLAKACGLAGLELCGLGSVYFVMGNVRLAGSEEKQVDRILFGELGDQDRPQILDLCRR